MEEVAEQEQTARHPIAVVAERTGLSQDVLRVWERRYGAVTPVRAVNGQRLYSDDDIERLRLISAATRAGRSIGQVARLSTPELAKVRDEDQAARKDQGPPSVSSQAASGLAEALTHVRALAAGSLEEELRRAAALMGVAPFIEDVAAPLMRQIGDEWHAGRLTPAHEHMASAVVYDIILDLMRGFKAPAGASRILITTPADERHLIGAAIAGATAAASGWEVIFLGGDLPAADIARSSITTGAAVVAVSIVHVNNRARLLTELRELAEKVPENVTVIAGGEGARQLVAAISKLGIKVVNSAAELQTLLSAAA